MKPTEAFTLFRSKIEEEFPGYLVTFTRQSRAVKPELGLIAITPGNIRRPLAPVYDFKAEGFPGYYLSRIPITIDLFTHGQAVTDGDGDVVGYLNSATEELIEVLNYLNSNSCVEWCGTEDISILLEGEIQDISGMVDDANYEFRARQDASLYFTQSFDSKIGELTQVVAIEENNELRFISDETGSPITDMSSVFIIE